jgi:hypothetical protein
MVGYNQNFESFVNEGTNYTTYYIRFVDFDKDHQLMGDYVPLANMVIIAVESGSALETALEAILVAGLGAVSADNTVITTTTTTTT